MRRLALLLAAGVALGGCGSAVKPTAAVRVSAVTGAATTTAAAATTTAPVTSTTVIATPAPKPKPRVTVPRPPIIPDWIPFGPARKAQMAAYALRHYGFDSYRLIDPHVIVEHYSDASTAQADWNTFANDVPDVELHELPQVCAHFVVDGAGRIYAMVPTSIMCRHTVGLNYTAIGIEHTGFSDAQVLGDAAQMKASLELTRYLRCKFHIPIKDVIGHNESLSSPYHHELVASLRNQTHQDWMHADMVIYRRDLARLGGC